MNNNFSNWELMQVCRASRDGSKMAKANRASDMAKVREVLEALRSMRYWLGAAQEQGKTLKARKQLVVQGESELVAMGRLATGFVCDQLSTANTAANIRNAFSWFAVAQKVSTFKEWDEVVREFNTCCTIAVIRLGVVLDNLKCDWKNAKRNMIASNMKVRKYAKAILAPVALTKAQKLEIMKRNISVINYAKRVPVASNTYHLVSAAACISQREEGTTLNTKLWLRLIRTTRYNHINRNAHNWNNRQDYLVRLPVYTGGINLR